MKDALSLRQGALSDLPLIYSHLQAQFPPDEFYSQARMEQMLQQGDYQILLYQTQEELVGYATVYHMKRSNALWLDLLAVLPEHQNGGYGGRLFEAIFAKACQAGLQGMLLCAERVDAEDPEQAQLQIRRLQFYERHGAHRLHTDFLLPIPSGGLPMYLYYKPCADISCLPAAQQAQMLREMFASCYCHIAHAEQLLKTFNGTVVDESFETKQGMERESC